MTGLLLVVSSLLRAAPAAARGSPGFQTLEARMVVRPGATCLNAHDLAEHVTAWLGTPRIRDDLRIVVEGSAQNPRDVSFRIQSGSGDVARRQFVPGPERCEHLHAVVGLAVALAIRASLLTEITGSVPPDVTRDTRRRLWALAVQALGIRGVVPGWGVGAAARLERTLLPGLVLRAGILGLYGPRGSFPDMPGYYDTRVLAARLDACGTLRLSVQVDLRACQGLAGGALSARGHGFPRSEQTLVRWTAVTDSVDMTLYLSDRWSFNLSLEAILPLERTTIVVRNASGGIIERSDLATVGLALAAGPVLRF